MPRITPINVAEAIFEPFWDPQLSGLPKWEIAPGDGHGLAVTQVWCWVSFEWLRKPAQGPALCMTRTFDLDVSAYDRLLVCLFPPRDVIVRLRAETDRGERVAVFPPYQKAEKDEFILELAGAATLHSLTIELVPTADGPAAGHLIWVGLQNPRLLETHFAQWRYIDGEWEEYLAPRDTDPDFTPAYCLVASAEEIASLRDEHARTMAETGTSRFQQIAEKARTLTPEVLAGEFIPLYIDNRYNRVCAHQRPDNLSGHEAALAGLVLRDAGLLRFAARTVLSKAICTYWDETILNNFPGGIFEHRAFSHTLMMEDVVATLDLAGGIFSEAGRDYLLRRLADEGLGRTNFIVWKHDYIFHNNQLAAFSPGRIQAYAVLERHWQHVTPYLELAYQELVENFNNILLPDGGYAEGPAYFWYGVGFGIRGLRMYARARGKTLAEVAPERLKLTSDYAAAILSTDDHADVIAFGDAHSTFGSDGARQFADCVPDSYWTLLMHKAACRERGETTNLHVPGLPALPAFLPLPHWGSLASHRKFGDEWVKLFIAGSTKDADHNHEDKGSFVLEYAGDTFALEMAGYLPAANPLAMHCKHCELHNMLVPAQDGLVHRPAPIMPHPTTPLDAGLVVEGEGDDTRLHARIDTTPVWAAYFARWVRTFDSPTPDVLTIRDDYALIHGEAVEFHWQTRLPVTLEGDTVLLTGRRGVARISIPAGCSVRVEEMQPDPVNWPEHRRITFRSAAKEGILEVTVKLQPRESTGEAS